MPTAVRTHVIRFALAAALVLAAAPRASADMILLSDVQVALDPDTLVASVSAGLEARSDTGSEVSLAGLSVSLFLGGDPVDLFAGPTLLDDLPFFLNTPATMADGGLLAPVVLFRLIGLLPGASYAGSFFLTDGASALEVPPQPFAFTVPQTPTAGVPEPGTLLLMGIGGALAALQRRRRLGSTSSAASGRRR
jgi:hypothetical protein